MPEKSAKKSKKKKSGRRFTKVLVLLVAEDMDREIRQLCARADRSVSSLGRELLETGLVAERARLAEEKQQKAGRKKASKKKGEG